MSLSDNDQQMVQNEPEPDAKDIALHTDSDGKWIPLIDPKEIDEYAEQVYLELYEVYKERVKTKKQTKEAYLFSREAGMLLWKISVLVVTGQWNVKGYFKFKVHHPERIINAPFYVDRIVEQWLIEKYFIPVLEGKIYKYNMACQVDKGPDKTKEYIKSTMEEMYEAFGADYYIFQYDCRKYFDNICHEKALEKFRKYGVCDFALYLYQSIQKSYSLSDEDEDYYGNAKQDGFFYGMPKGNLPSQWTGIMLLNELDWEINFTPDISVENYRYMDDHVSFCIDKAMARKCYHFVENRINKSGYGLMLHPKKTNIFPISRGLTFCGWHFTQDRDTGIVTVTEKQDKKREQLDKLDSIWSHFDNVGVMKAKEVRYGVVSYFSRGNKSEGLTHQILKKYQLFDGEYDTFYKGKKNPLNIKAAKDNN